MCVLLHLYLSVFDALIASFRFSSNFSYNFDSINYLRLNQNGKILMHDFGSHDQLPIIIDVHLNLYFCLPIKTSQSKVTYHFL